MTHSVLCAKKRGFMNSYSPKKNSKAKISALMLILLSVIIAAAGGYAESYSGIFSVVAMISLVGALYITTKFVIASYTYEISGDDLLIIKTVGAKKSTIAAISLKTGYGIMKKPSTKEEKDAFTARFGHTDLRLGYLQNIGAEVYVYVTEFNGKKYEIYLETGEDFARVIADAVISARNLTDND